MRFLTCAALISGAVALTGCASLITGASEDVAISTAPISGAACELSNLGGSWTVVTPGAAHVERGLEDLQIKCTKSGYEEAWTNVASHWDGLIWGNIFNAGVGFGVDAYTGAEHEYPHSVELPMQPTAPPAPESPPTAPSPTSAPAR